jgi:hypothetical protein
MVKKNIFICMWSVFKDTNIFHPFTFEGVSKCTEQIYHLRCYELYRSVKSKWKSYWKRYWDPFITLYGVSCYMNIQKKCCLWVYRYHLITVSHVIAESNIHTNEIIIAKQTKITRAKS